MKKKGWSLKRRKRQKCCYKKGRHKNRKHSYDEDLKRIGGTV